MFNASIMPWLASGIQTDRAYWVQPLLRLALPGTFQFFYISLLFETFGRNKLVNNGAHDLSTQIDDNLADITGSQQTVTLGVDTSL